jgi:TorA maturation chaperone TorD
MSEQVKELDILSALLAEPCEESLATLEELAPQLPWLSAEALIQLQQTPLEHWQAEHTRLFVSGHPKTPCMPFESVWTEGQMMGETVLRMSQWYGDAGFKVEAELPTDFLGTELQFLAFMIEHHREAEEQIADLLLSLQAWIPKFATAVKIHTDLLLYKDWAKRLETLFHHE